MPVVAAVVLPELGLELEQDRVAQAVAVQALLVLVLELLEPQTLGAVEAVALG
jgi:hypothetical protein